MKAGMIRQGDVLLVPVETLDPPDVMPAPVVAPHVSYMVVLQREWNLAEQWRKVSD